MFKERAGKIFNVFLILGTVIGILQPAFSSDVGLTQIILSLFEPQWSQAFLMRWLFVLVFIASSYNLILGMIFKNIPVTVISARIDVRFKSNDGSLVEIQREQLLRANQPDVTAYFSKHVPGQTNGTVPFDRITASAFCESRNLADTFEVYGEEHRQAEVIHKFGQSLPYAWFMPLVPNWFLNRDYNRIPKFFRKYVVVRRITVFYANEYNVPKPVMDFNVINLYRHFNMYVNINFNGMGYPAAFAARRIKHNGIVDVPIERENNTARIRLDRVRAETLRITW